MKNKKGAINITLKIIIWLILFTLCFLAIKRIILNLTS